MSFLDLPRVPESEAMDDSGDVEAYASAAAQSYLDQIDNTFVEHALRLVAAGEEGAALDIGTGPGQIVMKIARRLPRWKFCGVDRAPRMIEQANTSLTATPELATQIEFRVADGNRLPFPDASFDFVMCNSVLHHLAEPADLFAEMARLAKPEGAILLRDLRRPSRLKSAWHTRWHGRHYSGTMRKLYRDSVCAAYTPRELEDLLAASPLRGARVFLHRSTHLGIERPFMPLGGHC